MKAANAKKSTTTSRTAAQAANQPFFAKAGGGDFFASVNRSAAPSVQTKMAVNKPGDKFEQEADKMAGKVMRMPTPAASEPEEKVQRQEEEKLQKQDDKEIQKTELPEEQVQKQEKEEIQKAELPEEQVQKQEKEEIQKADLPEEQVQKQEQEEIQKAEQPEEQVQKQEQEEIQKAEMPEEQVQKQEDEEVQRAEADKEEVQRKGNGAPAVNAATQSAIRSKTTGGQPLSGDVRSFMEPRFNADFSNVRVHSDGESAGLNNQLSARAFTYQNHIFFSRDQYQPGTSEGKQLLAHELTHTIQQTGGSKLSRKNSQESQSDIDGSIRPFSFASAKDNNQLYLQRSILSSLKDAAGAGWNAVAGIAEKGWSWVSERVIEPLKSLASQGWGSVKLFGDQIAEAYRQAEPTTRDAFGPMHLVFRTVRNLRRNLVSRAIQEEKQHRIQDAVNNPDPDAIVNEPSQLEQLNEVMETFESGIDKYYEINNEIVEGAILGDFKENPTIWNTIGQIAMGFVPYAGQVADVRDMVAAIIKLRKSGWKDGGAWFDLVLTGIGFIPGLGDAIKAGGRGAKKILGKTFKGVLKNADVILRPVLKHAKGMLLSAWKYGGHFVNWARKLGPKLLRGVQRVAGRAVHFARSIGQRARWMVGVLKSRVGSLLRGAMGSAKGLLSRARGFLGQVAGRFLGRVRRVFGDVRRRIAGAAASVRQLAQRGKEITVQVGRRIAKAAQGAKKLLQESVQSAMKRGREALVSAKSWGIRQVNRARELGGRLVRGARRRVTGLIRRGKAFVKEKIIKLFKEKWQAAKRRILSFLRDKWNKLKEKLGIKKSGKEAGGRKAKESINRRSLTQEAVNYIRRIVNSFMNSFKNWGRKVFERFRFKRFEVGITGEWIELYGISSKVLLARALRNSVEDWIITNTPGLKKMRHSRSSQLGKARSAAKKGDQALTAMLRSNAVKISEGIGEKAADAVIKSRFANAVPLFQGSGRNTVDLIYRLADNSIVIVEAKGGAGRLINRKVGPGVHAQQGTVTYLRSVLQDMLNRGGSHAKAAEEALTALNQGKLRYFLSETPVPHGTAPLETKISEFRTR